MQEMPTRIQPGTLQKQEVIARKRGVEVVERLMGQIEGGGCVDEFLADQIVIFMALAVAGITPRYTNENGEVDGEVDGEGEGRCEVLVGKVSLHCETAMRIAEIMVPEIEFITEKRDGGEVIICQQRT